MKNIVYEYFHDKSNKLYTRTGKNNPNSPFVNKFPSPHFHRSVEVLYVLSGGLKSKVGEEQFIAQPNEIVFVHNYYLHSFCDSPDYEKIIFIIPHNFSHNIDKILLGSTLPSRLTDKNFNKTLLPYFHALNDDKNLPNMVAQGFLSVIMGSLFNHYKLSPVEKNSNIDFMVEVLQYIDEHYFEEITLDTIAAAFGYNKYYFSRLFNHYIGESLSNYLNVVRVQHFIRKAEKEESVPVAKLAFDCGFDSLTTFYRYFNKLYGKTPKEYLMEKR